MAGWTTATGNETAPTFILAYRRILGFYEFIHFEDLIAVDREQLCDLRSPIARLKGMCNVH